MADRYWVAGTGNWDASTTTHWGSSSGTADNASVPGTGDNVIFDTASSAANAAYTVTITATANCADFTMDGPDPVDATKVTWAGSSTLNVYGSFNLSGGTAGITRTYTGELFFKSTSTGKTITSNGISFAAHTSFNGAGGGWTLQDAFDLNTTKAIFLINGTLNTNGKAVTIGAFGLDVGTKILTLGSTTMTLTQTGGDVVNIWNVVSSGTNFTLNADTSTIKITGGNNQNVFLGNGKTYYNLWFSTGASAGENRIRSSNIFNDVKDTGTAAHTLSFDAGTTQTVTTFTVNGNPGAAITLNSSTTAVYTLTKAGGGNIICNWLNVQHAACTPNGAWFARSSVNNQPTATAGSKMTFISSLPMKSLFN